MKYKKVGENKYRKCKELKEQVATALVLIAIIVASVLVSLILMQRFFPAGTSPIYVLRQSMFQCLSILTTTGSASFDYEQWPLAAKGILVFLMFIGGCSGSAGGGMKVIRIVILAKYFWKVLLRL